AQALLAGLPAQLEVLGQLGPQSAPALHVDRAVDGLGRHPPAWIIGALSAQAHGDLLGRPLAGQEPLHLSGQAAVAAELEGLGPPGPQAAAVLGDPGPVAAVERAVPFHLPADGRVRPAELSADLSEAELLLPGRLDELALLERQPFAWHLH